MILKRKFIQLADNYFPFMRQTSWIVLLQFQYTSARLSFYSPFVSLKSVWDHEYPNTQIWPKKGKDTDRPWDRHYVWLSSHSSIFFPRCCIYLAPYLMPETLEAANHSWNLVSKRTLDLVYLFKHHASLWFFFLCVSEMIMFVVLKKYYSQFWLFLKEIGYVSRNLWGYLYYFMYVRGQTLFMCGA